MAKALSDTVVRSGGGGVLNHDLHGIARIVIRWFTEAAERGDPTAQYNLAMLWELGRAREPAGGGNRFATAFEWCRRAAEQGDVEAQW